MCWINVLEFQDLVHCCHGILLQIDLLLDFLIFSSTFTVMLSANVFVLIIPKWMACFTLGITLFSRIYSWSIILCFLLFGCMFMITLLAGWSLYPSIVANSCAILIMTCVSCSRLLISATSSAHALALQFTFPIFIPRYESLRLFNRGFM